MHLPQPSLATGHVHSHGTGHNPRKCLIAPDSPLGPILYQSCIYSCLSAAYEYIIAANVFHFQWSFIICSWYGKTEKFGCPWFQLIITLWIQKWYCPSQFSTDEYFFGRGGGISKKDIHQMHRMTWWKKRHFYCHLKNNFKKGKVAVRLLQCDNWGQVGRPIFLARHRIFAI